MDGILMADEDTLLLRQLTCVWLHPFRFDREGYQIRAERDQRNLK